MNTIRQRFMRVSAIALLLGSAGFTQAQSLDMLKGLAGGASGSMALGRLGNAAGVVEYCLKNNYLSADGATTAVKDQLMGKIPGGKPAADPGYVDGSQGILTSADGKKMDLSGGGLQKEVTRKACDFVLKQAKGML